ncbi:hypothetical protein GCM10009798_43480 [Nocardioides panacihumi]|uniref:MarR family transcriptional regulator n=1 Tax=Nocardioides panacihumi TaxID=400774 RepID=A0ABN2RZ43_9ACTN
MTFRRHYDSARLPLWTRIVMYALDHNGQPLRKAELHNAVDPLRQATSTEITRAIRRAVNVGLLAPGSCCAILHIADEEDAA